MHPLRRRTFRAAPCPPSMRNWAPARALETTPGGDRWIRRLRGGAHQPAARVLRFSAPRAAAELLLYRTLPRCPRAPALSISMGPPDGTPADLRLDGYSAESLGICV